MKQEAVVGIDIGGTNTVFALIDRQGNVIAKDSIKTNDSETIDDFISTLVNKIKFSILNSQFSILLKGIGIGAPNGNFYKGTMENAVNLKWKGIIPLNEMLFKHFNVPVLVTNDANAAALGEQVYGGAKGMKDFLVVTLGTGLGSGFIVNGEVLYGHTGFAGELGHTIIIPEGRSCNCGRCGCLETYVSATGITRTVIEMLRNTKEECILRNSNPETLNSKLIYEAALRDDKIALDAFDLTAKLLARSLADTVTLTSPEAIFLFGGLADSGDILFKPLLKYFDSYLLSSFRNTVKILHSRIEQNNAAVLGASALAWHNL